MKIQVLPYCRTTNKALAISLLFPFLALAIFPKPASSAGYTPPASGEQLQIQFVASEPCALVMFIDILAERHHTSRWVKEWYEKKCKTTPGLAKNLTADKAPIAAYRKLIDKDEKQFNYVDEVGRTLPIDEVIKCQAARCNYIPELLTRLKGKLTADDIATLQDILYYFEPIYQEVIWKPRSAVFQKQLEEFKTQAVKTQICERLSEVRHFLNSPWRSDTPFIVALFGVKGFCL